MRKISIRDYVDLRKTLYDEICYCCGYSDYDYVKSEHILLFEDKCGIHVGAYIKRKTLRFCFPVYKDWKNTIEGVDSYVLYVKSGVHFEQVENYAILEDEDLRDFYVVIMKTDICTNVHFLELYHNEKHIFSIQTADRHFKYGVDVKLLYTTYKRNKFIYWVYKSGEHISLCESDNNTFSYSNYGQKHMKETDIFNGDSVELFFHYVNCKKFYVAEYFARTYGNNFEILPQQLKDDDTYNYKVVFHKSRVEDIAFMNYCMENDIGGYAVYGFPVYSLRYGCIRRKGEYSLWLEYSLLQTYIDYELQCQEVLKHIYDITHLSKDLHQVPQIKYFNKTGPAQSRAVLRYLKDCVEVIDGTNYKEKYNQIYERLIDDGCIQVKWKSEYDLYKLVKKSFVDTIYQFRAKWLGMQSLDIFIPSLRIGIEYQGIQHYRPIDIFGGREEFLHRKQLDEIKKNLCRENNVKLIYWRYDEKISKILLEKKIKEIQK